MLTQSRRIWVHRPMHLENMKNKTKQKRKKKEKGKNKSKLVKYQNTATLLTIPDDTFHQSQREKCSYSEFFCLERYTVSLCI